MRLTRRDRLLLVAPLAVLLTAWLVVPAVLGLVASFTSFAPGLVSVSFTGSDNYAAIFRDANFQAGIRNVVVLTLVAVPLELAIGISLAYALRRPFRGRGLGRVLLLIPWLVSPIAVGVMWHFLLGAPGIYRFAITSFGLGPLPSPLSKGLALGTAVGVEVWRNAPFVTFLTLPAVAAIPEDRWEQATLDGASWLGKLRHVVLPTLRPVLLAIGLILVGATLGAFDTLLILTGGGPGSETVTPALVSYRQVFEFSNWPVGAAGAWLIGGAVLLVGMAYLRFARGEPG